MKTLSIIALICVLGIVPSGNAMHAQPIPNVACNQARTVVLYPVSKNHEVSLFADVQRHCEWSERVRGEHRWETARLTSLAINERLSRDGQWGFYGLFDKSFVLSVPPEMRGYRQQFSQWISANNAGFVMLDDLSSFPKLDMPAKDYWGINCRGVEIGLQCVAACRDISREHPEVWNDSQFRSFIWWNFQNSMSIYEGYALIDPEYRRCDAVEHGIADQSLARFMREDLKISLGPNHFRQHWKRFGM